MSTELRGTLERLIRVRGVRAAMIVDAEAGVPIEAELETGVDGVAVAALTTSLFRRAARAVESGSAGALQTLQLEADTGHVVAADAGHMTVVVLTEPDAQLGLVRLETQRAADELR